MLTEKALWEDTAYKSTVFLSTFRPKNKFFMYPTLLETCAEGISKTPNTVTLLFVYLNDR